MEETLETVVIETIAPIIEEIIPVFEDTVVPAVTEATSPLMEQLEPLYEALLVNCNLFVVSICALGICAGILLGAALWRWLK